MATQTRLERIDLADPSIENLDKLIIAACDNLGSVGYRLTSSFVFGNHLILIFQKEE
jgi:hypothetical protein